MAGANERREHSEEEVTDEATRTARAAAERELRRLDGEDADAERERRRLINAAARIDAQRQRQAAAVADGTADKVFST